MRVLWSIIFVISTNGNPLVNLPNLGKIEGRYGKTYGGRYIYSFEGIPYARPPVGENRFKEPQPVKPWKGTWKATTIYKCMQYNQYPLPGQDRVIGDENCLYLNIHTPTLNENLDVLVYIHGGSFMFNYGGLYGPDFLLEKNVVLVTFNYRLGPLGFLSTENDLVPGNNGMKDQILALQFVKDQIKYFGGNSNSITIFGNSAGGVSVHFHYLSPKSIGLFHRGLSQSGTTLVPWALMEQPLGKTKQIATSVGCGTEDIQKMVTCLKTRPARQIVSSVQNLQPWLYIPFSPFGLVVDSWSADPVLPTHPYQLITSGRVYDVPWIVSHTSSEGLYPAEEFYENHLHEIDTQWNELIPLILDYNYTVRPDLSDSVSEKIRKYYLGDKRLSKLSFRDFVPVLSDRLFVDGVQKAAHLQASVTKSPVFFYQFGYRGEHSWFEYKTDGRDFGAAHADDVTYIFRIKAVNTTTSVSDRQMVTFLVDLLTSYCKNGVPNVSVHWPPMSKNLQDSPTYLKIDSLKEISVENGIAESEQFWDSLPILENAKLFSTDKDEL